LNLSVDPQASVPLYAQVVEQLSHMILGGTLRPGEALPSVRQLGQQLEINSLTIQKAFKLLETRGLIIIRRGVGAFVSDDLQVMPEAERLQLLQRQLEPAVRLARELRIARRQFDRMADTLWKKEEEQ